MLAFCCFHPICSKLYPNETAFSSFVIFKIKNNILFITNNTFPTEIRTKHFPNKSAMYDS